MQNLNSNIPPTTETLFLKKPGYVDLETVYDDKTVGFLTQDSPHALRNKANIHRQLFSNFYNYATAKSHLVLK